MPRPLTKKQKIELMAAESRITGDRISGLPEPILHHIFSFLDMKQAVQVSVLGSTWRDLWVSLRVLNFDYTLWNYRLREEFVEFVERVLVEEDSKIQKISFSSIRFFPDSCYIPWISAALKRGVEEIDLKIHGIGVYLPKEIFTTRTRVFKLEGRECNTYIDTTIYPAVSMGSSGHLKSLHLKYVPLPAENSNRELNLRCPNLESLVITDCSYEHIRKFNISAPRLENLVLENVEVSYSRCELKICTPNLKILKFKGRLFLDYTFETAPALISAEIGFKLYNKSYYYFDLPDDDARKIKIEQRMVNLLKGLWNAKSLIISEESLQDFANCPSMLDMLIDHIYSLKHLKVRMKLTGEKTEWTYEDAPVANLLKGFRGIETLVIEIDEVQEPEFFFNYASDNLKFVEVHNVKGYTTELNFFTYLLGNATALEKITVTTSKVYSKGKEKKMREFGETLLTLPRASSSVSVIFILKTSA